MLASLLVGTSDFPFGWGGTFAPVKGGPAGSEGDSVNFASDNTGDVALVGGKGGNVKGTSASESVIPASTDCALPSARACSFSAGGVGERWLLLDLVASTLSCVLRSGLDEHTLAQVFVAIGAAIDSVCSCSGTRHEEEVVLLASPPVLRSFLVPLETPCTLYTFTVSLSATTSKESRTRGDGTTGSAAVSSWVASAAFLAAVRRRFWAPLDRPSPDLARLLSQNVCR
jgi:hypothetical protein